ncbi:MAG: hypothetical protein DRP10_01240 [Candidatus Aenigmatarchaeota archaeon]|nr:MAG: hypothetical protein DRP10_01240 [Candidatus Aenigmarchaeota archaeon]
MAEIVVEVPEELEKEIKEFPENWSEVALKAIKLKVFELELKRSAELRRLFVEAISSKSKLSEEEADKFAIELSRKMKRGRFEQLKKTGLV